MASIARRMCCVLVSVVNADIVAALSADLSERNSLDWTSKQERNLVIIAWMFFSVNGKLGLRALAIQRPLAYIADAHLDLHFQNDADIRRT